MVELETVLRLASYSKGVLSNGIINGNFNIWQRGTTFNKTTSGFIYTSDRWEIYPQDGSGWNFGVSRQTASLVGSTYCARFQRTAGNTSTGKIRFAQSLLTSDSIAFVGNKLTLSFYARKGANYSPTNSLLNIYILSGTGTDENVRNGLTGEATVVTQDVTLTTSWQKFTITTSAVVGATVTQLAVIFNMTPVGTAGANDYFEVDQVNMNAGSEDLPYSPRNFYEDFDICEYFYQRFDTSGAGNGRKYTFTGTVSADTSATILIPLHKTMRKAPTATIGGGSWSIAVAPFSTASYNLRTPTSYSCDAVSNMALMQFVLPDNNEAGSNCALALGSSGSSNYIEFDAEL